MQSEVAKQDFFAFPHSYGSVVSFILTVTALHCLWLNTLSLEDLSDPNYLLSFLFTGSLQNMGTHVF